ncbi:MAG TPA: PAS domain-containing protein [Steroidobacteraceae bacterium]|jgi:diguanylate cyclase (GGDEF)-like protein/PAS domain S-box-containing protein|nr:PAS domain-containing protein [Steroidobacteraceae bacterium]
MMVDPAQHGAMRKPMPTTGIVMACTCLVLAGCCLLSLYVDGVRIRQLQFAALGCILLLAGCTAISIRRERRSTGASDAAQVALLLAVADALPMRVAYLDEARRFRFVNRAGCDRHGRTREELVGQPAAQFVTAFRSDRGAAVLQAVFDGHAQRFEHDDLAMGKRLRLETHLMPDVDPQGRVRGIFVIGVDITAMKAAERELRDLTDVIESTSDYVAQTDGYGHLKYLNPAARTALGLGRTDGVRGRVFNEFYTPETNERLIKEIMPAVSRSGVWIGETHAVLEGGRVAPVDHLIIAHRDAHGNVARYSSMMRDISSEVAARKELSRQTATLNAVIESIPAMVAVIDPQLRYRLVNQAYERWQARPRAQLVEHTLQDCMSGHDYDEALPFVQQALAGQTVTYDLQQPSAAQIKHVCVTLVPLRLEDGSSAGFISIAQDITAQREEQDRLLLLSERDPLTGLLNRAGFERFLGLKVERGDGYACGLLYIDLDRFKPINDAHGHVVGDEVLRDFASRIRGAVRPSDAVARLGGDEFAVVLSGLREPEDAAAVAQKIVELARLPFVFGEQVLLLSASVGVALNAEAEGGWKGLVRRADALLYQAKHAGRARLMLEPRDYQEDGRLAS